ncbi:MAG TPA: serine protease [Solirubrobacteraceae bacterium]|jgi:hypothetical protein|nr:serine protease [Solirubrobacteraceae bacterium]
MRRRIVEVIVVLAVGGAVCAPAATAAPSAPIHPGVQLFTDGAQCTANFVFRDAHDTYVGQAAHCSGTGAETATNGCTSQSLPIGTAVTVTGATRPGTLVYNSWLTMQALHETDADTCAYNDLALVRLDPADAANVDPTVPGFGGPTGVASGPGVLASVFSYGNSELRGAIAQLSPKQGLVVQVDGGGWSRGVYTVTPGIPGDSGSGFMNASGQAVGILSTLAIAPLPLSNGVGDLAKELDYMHAHSTFTGVQLVNGTRPFKANLLGAILGL